MFRQSATTMTRIKVKVISPTIEPPSRLVLLRTVSDCGVKVSTALTGSNGSFNIDCSEDCDVDKLFSHDCLRALKTINCAPILPPHVRARRTVLLRRLDPSICEHSADEIKSELLRANSNYEIVDLFKFPDGKIIKVTFANQNMAQNSIERGLIMFQLSVPPRNISLDKYYAVDACYRCYKLDCHLSPECVKPADYVICSHCSALGHYFKQCTAAVKCCINCGEIVVALIAHWRWRVQFVKK